MLDQLTGWDKCSELELNSIKAGWKNTFIYHLAALRNYAFFNAP